MVQGGLEVSLPRHGFQNHVLALWSHGHLALNVNSSGCIGHTPHTDYLRQWMCSHAGASCLFPEHCLKPPGLFGFGAGKW